MTLRAAVRGLGFSYVLAGCSVLADPSSLVIHCEVSPIRVSDDPCLIAGMHCVDSECKPCRGTSEICNGVDDDCDGVVDNGHDEDNDGFTWCGGGRSEFADCAPDDPEIHPAGPAGPDGAVIAAPLESCDGKDNDCDSKVDESLECSTQHSCVSDGCPEGQTCNAGTGVCVEPRPVGSGCTVDSECTGGVCLKKGQYDLRVDLSDNRCASACCSDSDCAKGSVCVVGSTGVRLCLPSNIAVRGSKSEVDRCFSDTECASGNCVLGRCTTPCSGDETCKNAVCSLSPGNLSEARRWSCGDSWGRDPVGTNCSTLDPAGCRSGLCSEYGECAKGCGRNADCGTDELCTYEVMRPRLLPGPSALVAFCGPRTEVMRTAGEALCCTNTDCGAKQCAPHALEEGYWVMSCR